MSIENPVSVNNDSQEIPAPDPMLHLELQAIKWVQDGHTLARREDGFPVFLRGAIPGEKVKARIIKHRASHAFALSLEILNSAPERIEDECPIFPVCGGCAFRHVSADDEFQIKIKLLQEFKHLPVFGEDINFAIFRSPENNYRTALQLHVDESGTFGFFSAHTNEVVPFPENGCALLHPQLNEYIKKNPPSGERGRYSYRLDENKILGPSEIENSQSTTVVSRPQGKALKWKYAASGFFQGNRFLIDQWLQYIRDAIPENLPRTAELFCGSGLIGGFCRDRLGRYAGYELTKRELISARANFKRYEWKGIFHRIDLYRETPGLDKTDLILVNPPRAGLRKRLCKSICDSAASHIIYSSCNAATLNRDLELLINRGFKVRAAGAFDFFPRTPHMEIVTILDRE